MRVLFRIAASLRVIRPCLVHISPHVRGAGLTADRIDACSRQRCPFAERMPQSSEHNVVPGVGQSVQTAE